MDELARLSEFVAETTFEKLPEAVVDRAKWVFRDSVGVIVAGMVEPEVRALADYAAGKAPGPATLLGHGATVTPTWAALVHGTAGTTLEMDEGHAFARGHAAIHSIPPALAMAQASGADGRALIAAIVAGYEVAARAGTATHLRPPVHPFGAWGVLGAATAGAWFRRWQPQSMESKRWGPKEIAGALELAASYAITPSFETAYQGATVRNTYAGVVNQLGLMATDFYELGFRGEAGALKTTFGEILGDSFEPLALSDGLGERYEMMRGYFKPYSGCRYTHAAIDAVLALRAEQAIMVDSLASIEVATYDIAAHLTNPAPSTPLAGRFSLPYVVAATLVNGSAGPEVFKPEMLANRTILDIAAVVGVSENKDFTAMTPAKRPAQVILSFVDGTKREKTVYGSKGDPDQPMTADELESKFRQLCDPVIGPDRAGLAWEQLGRLEQLPQLDNLAELFTPRSSRP